ncbi:ethylbenzene dehydrogenase-related protein [Halorientalis sp. IM1011]|uniref:ethylbenzene dehydrogenase-related protein n=1 Tax=Halorientalis sp. IM1011 TaxID=1932360 RepID=UPI0009FC3866|nr:ethylbenzene dehydrogenase-related protein [Halorientalis sp. IM1011]
MRERLPDRLRTALELPGRAAARLDDYPPALSALAVALAAGVFAVGLVVAAQAGLAMAVTGGSQPVAQTSTVPMDVDASNWQDAPRRTVTLYEQQMALPYGGGSVGEVDVKAMTNDTHVGFRLTYDDPTRDLALDRPGNYSDAAAVMLRTGEQPPITMGASGQPVDIWYWRASWQYANDSAEGAGDMYSYPHPDNETRPGTAAGNPISQATYDDFGQNYYAKGFGSLSDAPTQTVRANGERTEDGWQVVFVRERDTEGQYDATFGTDEPVYLAWAVWNGSADEVNGKKSVSLEFTKLTSDGSQLVAADSGPGDGTPTPTENATTTTGSGDGLLGGDLGSYLVMLVLATGLAWLYSYRKFGGEQ